MVYNCSLSNTVSTAAGHIGLSLSPKTMDHFDKIEKYSDRRRSKKVLNTIRIKNQTKHRNEINQTKHVRDDNNPTGLYCTPAQKKNSKKALIKSLPKTTTSQVPTTSQAPTVSQDSSTSQAATTAQALGPR